jgi:hypothetical protein
MCIFHLQLVLLRTMCVSCFELRFTFELMVENE